MGIKKSWKKTIQDYNVPTIFKEKLLKPYFCKLNLKEPILDAGSGTGYFSEMFASRGLNVIGIDQNKS